MTTPLRTRAALPNNRRSSLNGWCHANIECRLADARLIDRYELFVFEVVAARAATTPKLPKTIHYRGDGAFRVSGAETRKWRKLFRPGMLDEWFSS
jgi:flavin reductase (DIM6/NTAB) family NADH-FMN oxidoreductase RutF